MKYSLLVATSIWGICIGLNGCQSPASSSVEWPEITQESKPWIRLVVAGRYCIPRGDQIKTRGLPKSRSGWIRIDIYLWYHGRGG